MSAPVSWGGAIRSWARALRRRYSRQIHLIGGVGIGRLGDGISDSPIVDERGVGGGYAGLVYRF
ncbi:MAG: MipA/OmpV family protein [Candidatus Thiodiazotropha sp. (ex Dulcina madagascariensis)]|nr:MipA/OmpV family protein [Candidatus Thiodiazotropha sp. (ex Dulcina madagascariensis)]